LLGQFRPPTHTNASILAGVLGIALLINGGVFAATVTHDASPQPQLDQRDEQLTVKDLSIYYRHHNYYNVKTAKWFVSYRKGTSSISGPVFHEILPTFYHYYRYDRTGVKPPGKYKKVDASVYPELTTKYLFVGTFSEATGKIIVDRGESSTNYENYITVNTDQLTFSMHSEVYSTGKSSIYIDQSNHAI